jgi:hypothetical protein
MQPISQLIFPSKNIESETMEITADRTDPWKMPAKPRAILDREKAIEIFKLKPNTDVAAGDRLSSAAVAREYGVGEKTVRDIWRGRTWYHETLHLDPSRPVRAKGPPGRPMGRKDRGPRRRPSSAKAPSSDNEPEIAAHVETANPPAGQEIDPFHEDWPNWARADCPMEVDAGAVPAARAAAAAPDKGNSGPHSHATATSFPAAPGILAPSSSKAGAAGPHSPGGSQTSPSPSPPPLPSAASHDPPLVAPAGHWQWPTRSRYDSERHGAQGRTAGGAGNNTAHGPGYESWYGPLACGQPHVQPHVRPPPSPSQPPGEWFGVPSTADRRGCCIPAWPL